MDAELLKGFVEETLTYLPEIREGVSSFCQDSTQIEKLQNAQNQLHTIKGAALMLGLAEIGELSKELEADLKNLPASEGLENDTQSVLEKLEIFDLVLQDASKGLGEFSPSKSNLTEDFGEEFSDESENASDENTKEEAISDDFEDFEIDEEMLEIFAMEAEDHLQNIGTHLAILENTPNNREALLEIRRSSHTLKGSAGIVGFKKLSYLAHRAEDLLDYLADNEIEGDTRIFELLLASTDCLEALTRGQNTPELDQTISDIYIRFDQLMASLQGAEATQVSAVSNSETTENTLSQEEIALPFSASQEESAETAEITSIAKPDNRSVIRVSLERLDSLVKLVSEMVIGRSIFEQRLIELEQQIQELNYTTSRLRRSTSKLEVDFEATALNRGGARTPQYNFLGSNDNSWLEKDDAEFDTLEFDQYTEFHQTTRELIEATSDTSAIHTDIDNVHINLSVLFDNQRRLIEEMQDSLLRLRMVPLSSLAARLQRTVRVTANEELKNADLVIENEHIEIDTQILDSFVEPLIHLLRNAVAHGIEPPETRQLLGKSEKGKITLRAYSEGTHVVFVISDDGRGISIPELKKKAIKTGFISEQEAETMSEEESLSLIFLPGLSTTSEVNQISGRGVGMNVVKSSITRSQGTIFITSEPQIGTTFTVRLPMSLAVTRALLVKAADKTFALPLKLIKKVIEVSPEEVEKATQEKTLKVKNKTYKFFHFNSILNLPVKQNHQNASTPLLLLETPENSCALMIDELMKTEEIVIKPLGNLLRGIPDIIGATILGNGSIVPVLDLVHLLKKKPGKGKAKAAPTEIKSDITVLIVDDSPSVRQMCSNMIKTAGWLPMLAKDGIEALEILQAFQELPDIILSDVEMPRMDGYELLASLKRNEAYRKIPVIMITSRAGDKHRRKAFDLGASDYVSKPYEESYLLEKARDLINS